MAESAFLRRSFSNPTESCFQEGDGDPLRALGESISFGRYMSESLAWEKWSTFSHNRYLEEAEKYSKPGSVAKMKAYFEAHYKRIGAKKQAAQELVSDAMSIVEQEVQDNLGDSSSVNLGGAEHNAYSSVASPAKEAPDAALPPSVRDSLCGSPTQTKELQNEVTYSVETGTIISSAESPVEASVYQFMDPEINTTATECTSEDDMRVDQPSYPMGSDTVVATLERELVQNELKKENMDSRSKQKSAMSSIKRPTKSNVSKLSSSLARLATPLRPKKESCGTPRSRKSVKEPLEEKKPAQKQLRMSINSDTSAIKKDSQASQKTPMRKVFTPLGKIIRDSFASSRAPSRASVSNVLRPTSTTPHTETRRSRVVLEKAFDKSRKLEQKLQSPCVGSVKSSVQSPSPTTFSSFNFRTEERAAKRREFFQKRIDKEAEKMQLLDKTKQVKAKADLRKSCVNLKANVAEDIKTEVLSDNIKKIPPRRTESPKHRCKAASDLAPAACSRPPQCIIGSKLGIEKTKSIPTQSSTPLTKKKRHENASPNIL